MTAAGLSLNVTANGYRPHTMRTVETRSLPSTVHGVSGDLNSPYMKQFVHSKSQQYRRLKTDWKTLVYLGRSRIQVKSLPRDMSIADLGTLHMEDF